MNSDILKRGLVAILEGSRIYNVYTASSDTPRSSGWARWKADNLLLKLKKIRTKNIFLSWRNLILKKQFENIFENFENSFSKKIFFLYKIL